MAQQSGWPEGRIRRLISTRRLRHMKIDGLILLLKQPSRNLRLPIWSNRWRSTPPSNPFPPSQGCNTMAAPDAVRQRTITRAAKAGARRRRNQLQDRDHPAGAMVIWAGEVAQRPSDNSFDRLIAR
jgi:hypothetical protein